MTYKSAFVTSEKVIPRTYGLANIAGTVNPTTNRKTSHDGKFHASELKAQAMISKNKYTKNEGRRPQ